MKPVIIACVFISIGLRANSQHYYKDLLSTAQLAQKFQVYKQQKVKSIQFISFDANNEPIEGFTGEQQIANDFSRIETNINDPLSGSSQSTAYLDKDGQLTKTVDTSDGVKSVTQYEYDDKKRIVVVTSSSSSPGGFNLKEEHKWFYGANGKPERIVKIKNDSDTTYVSLVPDEKGNVAEERSTIKGRELPTTYYYYDANNNLTDIVRYNIKAKRLLPDYVFEYDDKGRVSTMLVVPEGSTDYQKWYYIYEDNGLKKTDACYSKARTLIAKIEYRYK